MVLCPVDAPAAGAGTCRLRFAAAAGNETEMALVNRRWPQHRTLVAVADAGPPRRDDDVDDDGADDGDDDRSVVNC